MRVRPVAIGEFYKNPTGDQAIPVRVITSDPPYRGVTSTVETGKQGKRRRRVSLRFIGQEETMTEVELTSGVDRTPLSCHYSFPSNKA